MAEPTKEPVRFEHRDLTGAHFEMVDLTDATFRGAAMQRTRIVGTWFNDVVLDGEVEGSLLVNGVDVLPFVEAELNRRYPGREQVYTCMTADADGLRNAWQVVAGAWTATMDRLGQVPEAQLHERVDGEWSVIENLRHLVFATDAWAKGALLGDPNPFDPLALPHTEMGEAPGVPNDPDARPSLEQALALWSERMAVAGSLFDDLTDERLAGTTEPNPHAGYPQPDAYPVRRCLAAVLIEAWEHRRYIERDLDAMAMRMCN